MRLEEPQHIVGWVCERQRPGLECGRRLKAPRMCHRNLQVTRKGFGPSVEQTNSHSVYFGAGPPGGQRMGPRKAPVLRVGVRRQSQPKTRILHDVRSHLGSSIQVGGIEREGGHGRTVAGPRGA